MTQTNGIGSTHLSGNLIEKADRTAQPDKQNRMNAANVEKSNSAQDAASLSGPGSLLASAATNTDDVRTDRVEALKAAIDAGTYHVPSSEVADRLLNKMLE